MIIVPITKINKLLLVHTREWERREHLGLNQVLGESAEVQHVMVFSLSSTLFCAKYYSCWIIFVFVFVKTNCCKVSYTLIISGFVLITGLIILWVNIIVLWCVPKRTPKYDVVFWVSYYLLQLHLLLLKLWLDVTIINIQSHASISRLNLFPSFT